MDAIFFTIICLLTDRSFDLEKYELTRGLRRFAFPMYKISPFSSLKKYTPGERGRDVSCFASVSFIRPLYHTL